MLVRKESDRHVLRTCSGVRLLYHLLFFFFLTALILRESKSVNLQERNLRHFRLHRPLELLRKSVGVEHNFLEMSYAHIRLSAKKTNKVFKQ